MAALSGAILLEPVRNPYGYDGENIAWIQSALAAMPVSLPASAACLGNAHRDRSKVTYQ